MMKLTCKHCGAANLAAVCNCGRPFVLTKAYTETRLREYEEKTLEECRRVPSVSSVTFVLLSPKGLALRKRSVQGSDSERVRLVTRSSSRITGTKVFQ
jgi:hypothetical protein